MCAFDLISILLPQQILTVFTVSTLYDLSYVTYVPVRGEFLQSVEDVLSQGFDFF